MIHKASAKTCGSIRHGLRYTGCCWDLTRLHGSVAAIAALLQSCSRIRKHHCKDQRRAWGVHSSLGWCGRLTLFSDYSRIPAANLLKTRGLWARENISPELCMCGGWGSTAICIWICIPVPVSPSSLALLPVVWCRTRNNTRCVSDSPCLSGRPSRCASPSRGSREPASPRVTVSQTFGRDGRTDRSPADNVCSRFTRLFIILTLLLRAGGG